MKFTDQGHIVLSDVRGHKIDTWDSRGGSGIRRVKSAILRIY